MALRVGTTAHTEGGIRASSTEFESWSVDAVASGAVVALDSTPTTASIRLDKDAAGAVDALTLAAPSGNSSSSSVTEYQIQWRAVGSEALLGSVLFLTDTFYVMEGLDPDTDYEWRVRIMGQEWTAWQAFRTALDADAEVDAPIAALTLTAPAGSALTQIMAVAAGGVDELPLAEPTGSATFGISTAAAGTPAAVTLAAPTGSAAFGVSVAAASAPAPVTLTRPAASAAVTVSASASGALVALPLTAPIGTGVTAGSSSTNAIGQPGSLSLVPPTGSTAVDVSFAATPGALTLSPPEASVAAAVSFTAALAALALSAPTGSASGVRLGLLYEIEWRLPGSAELVGSARGIGDTFYLIEELEPDTDYEWRVREYVRPYGYDDYSSGNYSGTEEKLWSEWSPFRTLAPVDVLVVFTVAALTTTPPTGSAAFGISRDASGAIDLLPLDAPTGAAAVQRFVTASGSIDGVTLTAPTGRLQLEVLDAIAFANPVSLYLVPPTGSTLFNADASGDIESVDLTPVTGTGEPIRDAEGRGTVPHLTLVEPTGSATGVRNQNVTVAVPELTLVAPTGSVRIVQWDPPTPQPPGCDKDWNKKPPACDPGWTETPGCGPKKWRNVA